MPHVEIKCFLGRTEEQKKECAERVAEVIAETLGCKTTSSSVENIWVYEEDEIVKGLIHIENEDNGAVHVGTKKFDFFPFTCGYMKKEL